jgi:hypothetical protein
MSLSGDETGPVLLTRSDQSASNREFACMYRPSAQLLQFSTKGADLFAMKLLALITLLAFAAAAEAHSLRRSEPRDQAREQRRSWQYGGAYQAPAPDHTARFCTTCERDARGHIRRNPAARRAFQKMHPCPATGRMSGPCPGYVVDHIVALKNGGADDPSNMQWQTVEEARAKDRIE